MTQPNATRLQSIRRAVIEGRRRSLTGSKLLAFINARLDRRINKNERAAIGFMAIENGGCHDEK